MPNTLVLHKNYEILDPVAYDQVDFVKTKTSGFSAFVTFGIFILTFFVGGSVYWALNAELDGAVVAPATFVVEGNRKTVQHLEGGIVSELLVAEGNFVEANQILIRMDSTDNDVNLDVFGNQLADLNVRRVRLLAQFNEKKEFSLADLASTFSSRISDDKLRKVFTTQKQLFETQLKASESEELILAQRITSLEEEIKGLEQQRDANIRQLDIAATELASFETLLAKGLSSKSRVNSIKREIERLKGADASFTTSQARALNQIGELRLSNLSQKKLKKEAISTEINSIEAQISSVKPQYLGALQKQKRIIVRAPVSGHVVNLSIYTKGGVIRPGEAILDIVPVDERLIVEARVNTSDIEKLRVGQNTRIRLTTFDQSDAPEALGKIVDLSADSKKDERTGIDYYVARVKLDDTQTEKIANLDFIPGMPADLFVNTGQRTAISYLLQPLNDRIARTFIE